MKRKQSCAMWLFLTSLSLPLLISAQANTPRPDDYSARQQLIDGIIWPSHEPLMFERRRGGSDVDVEKQYLLYHAEDNVKKIAAAGLRMSRILHFYKGFGLQAESEEMQRTVELAKLFHKYGTKVPVYIGGTMFTETLFREVPEAKNWARVDQYGQPVTYGFHQTARYYACFNEPGYVEYLKRVLEKAVTEVHADRIFFDNFTLMPEPQSCHNEACVRAFRAFLMKKYDDRGRTERFGFSDMSGVNPPIWNVRNQPWDLPEISDPLLQEWIDFRCWTITNYYRQLHDYIKSLNPAVSVGINIKGIMGRNKAFRDGIDHARLAEIGDWWELDPGYAAGVNESGALVSEIRSYKMGQSLGVPYDFEAETELRAAEYMAFNRQKETPGFGFNGGFRELIWMPHLFRYFDFFKQYDEPYYRGAQNIADVAILRGYASMGNNNYSVHRATILGEQVLIQHKIPFDIIFDKHLSDLSKYKVLFLADQECLSDSDLQKIRNFVEDGGGVVATGTTGAFDQWRRRRRVNGLGQALRFRTGDVVRGSFGKGRFVYLPAIIPASEPAERSKSGYRDFDPDYWLLPRNRQEIVEALRWASPSRFSAEVTKAPLNTVIELTRNGGQLMLHLLNYDSRETVLDIHADLAIPNGSRVKGITLYSPDDNARDALAFTETDGRARFKVMRLARYGLVVVELAPSKL